MYWLYLLGIMMGIFFGLGALGAVIGLIVRMKRTKRRGKRNDGSLKVDMTAETAVSNNFPAELSQSTQKSSQKMEAAPPEDRTDVTKFLDEDDEEGGKAGNIIVPQRTPNGSIVKVFDQLGVKRKSSNSSSLKDEQLSDTTMLAGNHQQPLADDRFDTSGPENGATLQPKDGESGEQEGGEEEEEEESLTSIRTESQRARKQQQQQPKNDYNDKQMAEVVKSKKKQQPKTKSKQQIVEVVVMKQKVPKSTSTDNDEPKNKMTSLWVPIHMHTVQAKATTNNTRS